MEKISLVCSKCGTEATACYWSDILKDKHGKRKTFSLLEPIPLNKATGKYDVRRIKKDYPDTSFIFYSEKPSAFTAKELLDFVPSEVGPHCAKCNAILIRKGGMPV